MPKNNSAADLPLEGRRFVCPGPGRIELESFPIDALPEDGVLIENAYTAVSVGTEIYGFLHGDRPGKQPAYPRYTGYCNAGTVRSVGPSVSGVRIGDRVAGQGRHASHVVLTKYYHRVPDGVPSKEAALLVMAAVALNGIRKARLELGTSVVVLGLGLVGQLAVVLAKLAGAFPIVAIDLDGFRLKKAGPLGADHLLNPSDTADLTESVRSLCPEDGANVVIEATGLPRVYPTAIKLACRAGRVVALGSPRGTVEMNLLDEVHLREVALIGAFQPFTPDDDHIYYQWTKSRERGLLLDLMAAGRLPVADLITHVARPEQCQEIYTMLAENPQNALGVLFDWT